MRLLLLEFALLAGCHTVAAVFEHDLDEYCSRVDCALDAMCQLCTFPKCEYGDALTVRCHSHPTCAEPFSIERHALCRYCWQTDLSEHRCEPARNCSTLSPFRAPVKCFANPDVVCNGRRDFYRQVRCDWSSGYSWTKTLFLSVTLGGFGFDRFYLGLWKSALGKLLSFGGLGVWTVLDVVLIACGYLRPADGSHYLPY